MRISLSRLFTRRRPSLEKIEAELAKKEEAEHYISFALDILLREVEKYYHPSFRNKKNKSYTCLIFS